MEVDPGLVLHSLQILKRDLEARAAPFRLSIEVVRPGSFQALKKHLGESSRRQKEGDIQIVHFDMHGGVVERTGPGFSYMEAVLEFCSERTGRRAQVRAATVAELLEKYNIRIAVLNACESATANKGDEANIAKTFTRAGVQNILAMAYQTCASSCESFMRRFYQSLIAEGKPFSLAVRDAREDLRVSTNREARFALIRSLEDWIVPVVYATGKDVELHTSAMPESVLEGDSMPMVPAESSAPQPPATPLIGRGIDVLRFETMFLGSRITGLCGPAGVGKSAFVDHLARSWKDTGLYDDVLQLDCALIQQDEIDAAVFLRHLLCHGKDKSPIPDLTGPKQEEYRSWISAHRGNIRVVVLDNLEASYSDVEEMNDHGRWPESTRSALMAVINDIIKHRSEEADESISFILVGRSEDDSWWRKSFPDLPPFLCYHLHGLSLPDAINYGHILLGKYGLDMSKWGHADEDVLSQILNLLQCNPLAIQTVLETAVDQGYHWRELFEEVLFRQDICALNLLHHFSLPL